MSVGLQSVVLFLVVMGVASSAAARELGGRVVDAHGAPLADAVVFVADGPPPAAPPPAVVDQVDKQFVPRLLVVPVGTAVTFPNRDQIHHHVYSFSPAKTFEIPLYKGEPAAPVVFDRPGAVTLGCNIHDWMSAVVLVVPTAHFARTGADGQFTLRDLPDAPLTLVAWHATARSPAASTRQIGADEPGALQFTLETTPRRARRGGGGRSYE